MENKQYKFELVAERKTFVDKQSGETRPYVALHIILDGQPIKVTVPTESKQLFNYLFDKICK